MPLDWGPCLKLAKRVSAMQAQQEISGINFDQDKARTLLARIEEEMEAIRLIVLPQLPPRPLKKAEEQEFTLPAKPFLMNGQLSSHMLRFLEKHGCTVTEDQPPQIRWLDGSLHKIEGRKLLPATKPMDVGNQEDLKVWFKDQGWEPTLFNFKKDENGKVVRDPKTKEPIRTSAKMQENGKLCPNLEAMQGELVKPIVKYLSYRNRQSVVNGWLENPRLAFDGKLTAGSSGIANTFRQRHTCVTNVPKNKEHVLLGKEMRELFIADNGEVLIGFDASSLEDRIKGHLTYKYDDGRYAAKILSEGYDPHQENADIWHIDRSIAKNGTYALGYFCGIPKLAATIKCTLAEATVRHEAYWNLNDALRKLDEALGRHWEANGNKYIVGLDGRKVFSRHRHGLVNLAIQSSATILMDWAGAWMDRKLGGVQFRDGRLCYVYKGKPASRVAYIHDEYVYSCDEEIAEDLQRIGETSILKAGEFFKLRVPLISTAAAGHSWADLK